MQHSIILAVLVVCLALFMPAHGQTDLPVSTVVKKDGPQAYVYNPVLQGANGTMVGQPISCGDPILQHQQCNGGQYC
jgi:Flp pilus assembly protein CpaB